MYGAGGEGKIDFVVGQVTALEGEGGRISKAVVKTGRLDVEIACTRCCRSSA